MTEGIAFNPITYWNGRYAAGHGSGAGSMGKAVERKVELLSGLNGINTILEVGCGDFVFGSHLIQVYEKAKYLGVDISAVVILRNQLFMSSALTRFAVFEENEVIPAADMVLCLDVLFHIIEDWQYEKMLARLESMWTKYLAVTAYEYDDPHTSPHVRIRKFDPSTFGVPVKREVIEEDGQMYFYLFKR